MGEDGALLAPADDGIALPVADAAFFSGDGGAFRDVHAARDQAAPGVLAFALVVLLAVVAQVAPKTSPVSLVLPDMLIDAFWADKPPPLFLQPAADLLWAPLFLRQFLPDLADEAWRMLSPVLVCS